MDTREAQHVDLLALKSVCVGGGGVGRGRGQFTRVG